MRGNVGNTSPAKKQWPLMIILTMMIITYCDRLRIVIGCYNLSIKKYTFFVLLVKWKIVLTKKLIELIKGEVNTNFFFFVTLQVRPKYYKKIKVTSHLPFVRSENTLFCSTKSSIFNKMRLLWEDWVAIIKWRFRVQNISVKLEKAQLSSVFPINL